MNRLFTICGITLYLLCIAIQAWGQNLVVNGNFEKFSQCPYNLAMMSLCNNWRQYHSGSADFYACTDKNVGVPNNFMGHQYPAQGLAYAGVINYLFGTDYKEYVAGVTTPLTKGYYYEVSLSVSLANNSIYAGNDLGVWFYDKGPTATLPVTFAALKVKPQVSFARYGIITDSTNWIRLRGVFYADSAYDNIVIGGFTPNDRMTVSIFNTTSIQAYSYFYIDSVVLQEANIGYTLSDTAYCVGDTLRVSFLPKDGRYNTGNVFTLQLSDATGSFNTPDTIATQAGTKGGTFKWHIPLNTQPGTGYRIRVLTTDPVDSSVISDSFAISNVLPDKPVATGNMPCQGDTLRLHAASNTAGVAFKWTGPLAYTAYGPDAARAPMTSANVGAYIVTASLYGCTATDTVMAEIIGTKGIISGTSNSPVCDGDTLKLFAHSAPSRGFTITYLWTGPAGFTSALAEPVIAPAGSSAAGHYILNALISGCRVTDTVDILVVINPSPAPPDAQVNDSICSGDTIRLMANSSGPVYRWSGPDGFTSSLQNPFIPNAQLSNAGKYILIVSKDGCSNSDTVDVALSATPAPRGASNSPLKVGDTLLLSVLSPKAGMQYSWSGPAGFTSSSLTPAINNVSYVNAGTYTITATENGCTSAGIVLVTIDGPADTSFFNVYPNANNGNFTIFGTVKREQYVPLNITASNGQLVYRDMILTQNKLLKVSISLKDMLASGIYTLRVYLDGQVHSVRLVVNRGMQ